MQDDHSRAEVEEALAGILADDKFACAPQMSAFLAYVVRQTLDGRAERIKAYTIGIEALGKPESFDSQTDPSVRVLAKRLRTCLVAYHERHPEASPVIEIRPGCYRPLFLAPVEREAASEAGSLPSTSSRRLDEYGQRHSRAGAREPLTEANEETTAPGGSPARRDRPALPAVRVSDAYRPGSSGAALAAVATGVLARAEGLQALRHSRDETTTWPEDYTLSLEAIESGKTLRVELQLVRGADGLVVHALTCRVALGRDGEGGTSGELPPAAVEAVERFAASLASADGILLRDYRAHASPGIAANAPHTGALPTPQRRLALEALRYPSRDGSPLADAA